MKNIRILMALVVVAVILVFVFWSPMFKRHLTTPGLGEPGEVAQGFVFHDRNGNGVRDEGERAETDKLGRWMLPKHAEAIYFVVKPRGYMTTLSEENLPRFYYIHRENEPLDLSGPTVHPTGPLPESIDFPLVRQTEPDHFQAIIMGDPQPRNLEEVNFLAHDVLEELVGTTAAFAVTLGDITFDRPELYPDINRAAGTVGIPFYNTHGNHDANYDGLDTYQHYETWRTVFGPRYYSFDYGPVHFVILSDVIFPEQGTRYVAGLGQQQLQWLEQDLSFVPEESLVVLAMHIPLQPADRNADFARLYELLQDRPYTLSFSAHSHTLSQGFLTEEHGWGGVTPHHHIVAGASCGRWWGGARDETDIPHATGSDGTPNGYFVVTFDGHDYSTRFKAARRPPDYQMQIQGPDEVAVADLEDTPVLVNVFNGNEKSIVEMAVGESGEWAAMEYAPQVDPLYERVTQRESGQDGSVATHIWEGRLPPGLPVGGHLIRVRTVDMYGQEFNGTRIIRVLPEVPMPESPPAAGPGI
jgi:hypothetical protein